MDLRHLRYFVAIAEAGGVSRAAAQLNVSQPAISRQLNDLEAELGVALFQRVGRGLRLTGEGEDLLFHAQRTLSQSEMFRDRARALRRGEAGVLRVGATPQTLERLFPTLLGRFKRLRPGVDVRLTEGDTRTLLEHLQRDELHLALTAHHPELAFEAKVLGMSPLLAVGPTKTLPEQETVEIRSLENLPLLLLKRGFGSRDLFDAACRLAHIEPRPFLESGAPDTLLALARAGHGVAVLPATVEIGDGDLVRRRIAHGGATLANQFAVHWHPQRFLPAYGTLFIEELAACASAEYAGLTPPHLL